MALSIEQLIIERETKTLDEIALLYNTSRFKVTKLLKINNININTVYGEKDIRTILNKNKDIIIKDYLNGKSSVKLAKEYNCIYTTIIVHLKKWNIDIKTFGAYKIYSCNEYYFKKIDTEEKAYILGFLYADGNVFKNRMDVALHHKDIDILEKIKNCLSSNHPILDRIYDNYLYKAKNTANQKRLSIISTTLTNDLKKLGCVPNKSLILEFPTEEQVSKEFQRHFIRGYFDGDGSVMHNINKKYHVSFCGTYDFLKDFQDVLILENISNKTKIYPMKNNKAFQLTLSGNNISLKFKKYIYEDITIYLNRKFNKFNQHI